MTGNDGDRHYQRYFSIFQWWMHPDELDAIRKEMGTADEILERHKRVDEVLALADGWRSAWRTIKRVGIAFTAILVTLQLIKSLLPAGFWPW